MREGRFVVAGTCVGAMFLGVTAETIGSMHPPGSECFKLTGLSVCRNPAREATIPPHVHTTMSNSTGTSQVVVL
jgi:hypothetical protein